MILLRNFAINRQIEDPTVEDGFEILNDSAEPGYKGLAFTNSYDGKALHQSGLWARALDADGNYIANVPITISASGDGMVLPSKETSILDGATFRLRVPYYDSPGYQSVIQKTDTRGMVIAEVVLSSQDTTTVQVSAGAQVVNKLIDSKFIPQRRLITEVRTLPSGPLSHSQKGAPCEFLASPVRVRLFDGDTSYIALIEDNANASVKFTLSGDPAVTGSLATLDGGTDLAQEHVISLSGSSVAQVWWKMGCDASGEVPLEIESNLVTTGGTVYTDTATVYAEVTLLPRFDWMHHVKEDKAGYVDVDVSGGSTAAVVTTDFDELMLRVTNPFPHPVVVRTTQIHRSPLDDNTPQILNHAGFTGDPEHEDGQWVDEIEIPNGYAPETRFRNLAFTFTDDSGNRMKSWGGEVRFEYVVKGLFPGQEAVLDSFTIDVVRPLVILMSWDGVPRVWPGNDSDVRWFHDLVLGRMTSLSQMMGYQSEGLANGIVDEEVFTLSPATTYPIFTSMFTDLSPGQHGMASIAGFVDRDQYDPKFMNMLGRRLPFYYSVKFNPISSYMKRKDIFEQSLYHQLDRKGYEVIVSGAPFLAGSTRYLAPGPGGSNGGVTKATIEPGFLPAFWADLYSTLFAVKTEQWAFENARIELEGYGGHCDFLNIYVFNTDHSGHSNGIDWIDDYLVGEGGEITSNYNINRYIDEFNQSIVDNNLDRNTIYILHSDHGRIEVGGLPTRIIATSDSILEIIDRGGFEYKALFPASKSEFGRDGTMLSISLRDPDSDWPAQPSFFRVKNLAKSILDCNNNGVCISDASLENPFWDEALQEGVIKYVLITDHSIDGNTCADIYCGATVTTNASGDTIVETIPLDQLFSTDKLSSRKNTVIERLKRLHGPNSPNLIILLKSVGNTETLTSANGYWFHDMPFPDLAEKFGEQVTVHGGLSDYESNNLFYVFYPYLNRIPAERSDFKTRMTDFVDNHFPRQSLGNENARLLEEAYMLLHHSVDNSNQLLMEQ